MIFFTGKIFSLLKSVMVRMYRKRVLLLTLAFIVLSGSALSLFLLNKYFPSELLKIEIERIVSESIDGKVSISNLDVVPLRGIRIDNLSIDSVQTGSIRIDHLLVDYDLKALLKRRVEIRSIRLEGAKIKLSLPESGGELAETSVPETSQVTIPSVPVTVSLHEFVIKESDIEVMIGSEKGVSLKGINLMIGGELKESMVGVRGRVSVKSVEALTGEKSLKLPLNIEFQVDSDLATHDLAVSKFTLSAGNLFEMAFRGDISDFLDERRLLLKFSAKKLDLDELRKLLAPFIPENYSEALLSGTLSAEADVRGSVKELFAGELSVRIRGQGVSAKLREPAISLEPLSFNLNLDNVVIEKNSPTNCEASMAFNDFHAAYNNDSFSFGKLAVKLSLPDLDISDGALKGRASFYLDLSSVGAEDRKAEFALLPTGVHLEVPEILLSGGIPDIKGLKLDIDSAGGLYMNRPLPHVSVNALGELSRTGAAGAEVTVNVDRTAKIHLNAKAAPAKSSGEYDFSADLRLIPNINGLKDNIPPDLLSVSVTEGISRNVITSTVSGRLSSSFTAKTLKLSSTVDLNNIGFKLYSPPASGRAERLGFSIDSNYSAASGKLGAKITSEALFSGVSVLEAAKELNIDHAGLTLSADAKADFFPDKGVFENISSALTLRSEISGINEKSTPVRTDSVIVSATVSGSAKDLKSPESLSFSSVADISGIRLPGATIERVHSKAAVKTKRENFSESVSHTKVEVTNISYKEKSLDFQAGTVSLGIETREDLDKKIFTVADLTVKADDFFGFRGRGSYNLPENIFSVEADMEKVDLKKVAARLNGDKVRVISDLKPEGIVAAKLRVNGKVPDFPVKNPLEIAVKLDSEINLENGSGNIGGGRFSGANMRQVLRFSPARSRELVFENSFSLESFLLPGGVPDRELTNIFENTAFVLKDFDRLKIKTLNVGTDGANFSLEGSMEGLRAFLSSSGANAVKGLYANVRSKTSVMPGKFIKFIGNSGKNSARGEVLVTLDALKNESGKVVVSGNLKTAALGFITEDFQIDGVDLSIPFRKELLPATTSRAGRSPEIQGRGRNFSQSFFNGAENLSVKKITAGTVEVNEVTGRVEFGNNTFSLNNLAMNLLGGGAGGDLEIYAGEKSGTEFTFTFSNIDINRLLPEGRRVKGDADISGVVTLKTVLQDKDGEAVLDRARLSLHLTKIGRESLDIVLLLIDPEESTPAIIHARSKLKFANPSNVSIAVSGGFLSLGINFQQGVISSVNLDRVPVGSMGNLKQVSRSLAPLKSLLNAMKILSSETYSVGTSGIPYLTVTAPPK